MISADNSKFCSGRTQGVETWKKKESLKIIEKWKVTNAKLKGIQTVPVALVVFIWKQPSKITNIFF